MTGPTRRTLLLGAGAALALAPLEPALGHKDPAMTISKIDTHHHFLPAVYVEAVGLDTLAGMMPTRRAPEWSVERALTMMDGHGIAQAILSISSGPTITDAPAVLRRCNEAAADLRARHPARFGSFASLPLPDIDASLAELAFALDSLKTEGVILFTNYDGAYLGDARYAPLFAELDRRGAVAFIHPNSPPYRLAGLPPESVLEFPFDTTRTAASMILAGVHRRYPRIRFILSHAGGTLPYLADRLAGAVRMNPASAEMVGDPAAALRSFWYDTALSMNPSALAGLKAVADPARILFGTDFPMAPPFAIDASVSGLDMMTDAGLRQAIGHGNAAALFGRGEGRKAES